jgi:hypothetical protein
MAKKNYQNLAPSISDIERAHSNADNNAVSCSFWKNGCNHV